jgi:hypothetical protein
MEFQIEHELGKSGTEPKEDEGAHDDDEPPFTVSLIGNEVQGAWLTRRHEHVRPYELP